LLPPGHAAGDGHLPADGNRDQTASHLFPARIDEPDAPHLDRRTQLAGEVLADDDGDGIYDTLNVETRGISGPRLFDANLPLADDDSTVVNEKIYLDKSNKDLMRNEITTRDSALTRPWTVTRTYRRAKNPEYAEYNCEDKRNVVINGRTYWVGIDGYLMPIAKDQPPPDLRYFSVKK
jgi:hypothetical protein